MSPVAPSSGHASRALVLSFLVVALGMGLVWGASAVLTSRHNNRSDARTVGGVVNLGSASKLLAQIERHDGVPIYYPDVSGNAARAVYITHRGDRSSEGWSAFLAQVPGEASSCQWEWNRDTERFDASCDASRHADRHGDGLLQYPATVVKNRLHVDLTVTPTNRSTVAP
jgi:hypothetical protein